MAQENHSPRLLTSAVHTLDEGVFRIGPLTNLPALLRDLGHDPTPIFAIEGFDPADFADPDRQCAFIPASNLLARCVAVTGCDHLGLLLGERATPSVLGIAGFMMQAAPHVGTALRDLVRYQELQDRGAVATLTQRGQLAYLGYAIHLEGVEALDQIYDHAMAVICQIMRNLCGPRWKPAEVHLSRQQPRDLQPYKRFFAATLYFDAEQSVVAFPMRWLNHSVASADPLLHRHFEHVANDLYAEMKSGLVYRVRRLLRTTLSVHRGGAAALAAQLGMHVRTLHRRLSDEGTSFRRELEYIRYEVARELLTETMLPLAKIAMALGYADSTVFIRAFGRWAGISPAEWRRLHHQSRNAVSPSSHDP